MNIFARRILVIENSFLQILQKARQMMQINCDLEFFFCALVDVRDAVTLICIISLFGDKNGDVGGEAGVFLPIGFSLLDSSPP